MKDRDREEEDRGDRAEPREREFERENGANGDAAVKGMPDIVSLAEEVDADEMLDEREDNEEPPPAHDDLDTAE